MKQTPKSCRCEQCTYSKRTKPVKQMMRLEERSFRHSQKQALNRGEELVEISPHGARYG